MKMGLFKRKRENSAESVRSPQAGEPRFAFREVAQNGSVYETYRSADVEAAKSFLLGKKVERDLYYIVVETPRGNWGMDVEGLYLENLLPWQLDTSSADCLGQIESVTNIFGLTMAARGKADNYVVRVACGRCGRLWHDALRYHDNTLVRCPSCGALNSIDSSGVTVSIQPGSGSTVIMSSYDITDETSCDPGTADEQDAARAGVEEGISMARGAVAATPPGDPHRPGRLYHLGSSLEQRFINDGRKADLDEAITVFVAAADTTPASDPNSPERLTAIGRALRVRFALASLDADLDAAVAALRAALATGLPVPDQAAVHLSNLGLALRDRFLRSGRRADINAAVEVCGEAVAATPVDHPGCPDHLATLSSALRVRFEHVGMPEDLDEAITTGRASVATAGPDHPAYFRCRSTLGLALHERSKATSNPADLDEAITAFTEASAAISPGDHNYAGHQHNLARALMARFQRAGDVHDLERAVTTVRAAVDATGRDDPDRPNHLSVCSEVLVARFERKGDPNDLEEGIAAGREAVALTPPGNPDRALYLSGVGAALLFRFQFLGQIDDLDEAVATLREAVATTPAAHPDRPGFLDVLAVALDERFHRVGRPADLNDAVVAAREAVAGTAPEHANYYRRLSNLGSVLHSRYRQTRHLADLDESIAAGRDAIAATSQDNPDRPVFMFNVSSGLLDRYRRNERPQDLDEAIAANRDAVAASPPDHPLLATLLNGLSVALRYRYGHTAKEADLHEAIATARDALARTEPDQAHRPERLTNLAAVLYNRFLSTQETTDLEAATVAARDAVAGTPADHPAKAHSLAVLGGLLNYRFNRTKEPADFDQAVAALREAAGVDSAPALDRMNAARLWGAVAIDAGRFGSATDGLTVAVRLLPQLAWHGLPRTAREERLAEWSGLAADGAACAIRAGRTEHAIELLEAGRSVLWAQLLNLRTDLTELAERRPDLAERLDRVRTRLDAPLPDTSPLPDPAGRHGAGHGLVAEERTRLAQEFDDLVAEVRTLPGLEKFLLPIPFAALSAAAGDGTVAVVNTSRYGCHALLVSRTEVQVVDLPGLTREQPIEHANTLLGILRRATGPKRPFVERERDRHTVLDILAWLWDTIASPVLTALDHTGRPAQGTTWPRIWWCPTGRLALLPLHAAGHHPRHRTDQPAGSDTVPDRVISSYAPTLTALLRAHNAPPRTSEPALLAIGMPTTAGAADLPAVPEELDRVHARYPITTRLQSAAPGDQPTIARVLKELPRHPWVHFACHGSQHYSDPTASAFWLTDGPLHIGDLIRQHEQGSRELAFLSACQTATGGLRAVDEAVHLAAAMQLLGYRDVIATLWSIYDSPAPAIADAVYAALAAGATDAAQALHAAVTELRRTLPTEPLAWAPYLHTGP